MIWKTWRSAHSEGSVRFSIPADIALSIGLFEDEALGMFLPFYFCPFVVVNSVRVEIFVSAGHYWKTKFQRQNTSPYMDLVFMRDPYFGKAPR